MSARDKQTKKIEIKKKYPWMAVVVVLLLWGSFGGLIYFFPPEHEFTVAFLRIPLLPLVLLLLFAALTVSFSWVFVCKRRGYLFALAVVGFLLMRLFKLHNPLFAGVFFSTLLVFELCFFLYDHRKYLRLSSQTK